MSADLSRTEMEALVWWTEALLATQEKGWKGQERRSLVSAVRKMRKALEALALEAQEGSAMSDFKDEIKKARAWRRELARRKK